MLRRAELTDLQVSDLLEEIPGDASLLVRRSKTDGEGVARSSTWRATPSGWCAPGSGAAASRPAGCFRSVDKGGKIGDRLDPSQVPRIFKAMADRAGLPEAVVDALSGTAPGSARPRT